MPWASANDFFLQNTRCKVKLYLFYFTDDCSEYIAQALQQEEWHRYHDDKLFINAYTEIRHKQSLTS